MEVIKVNRVYWPEFPIGDKPRVRGGETKIVKYPNTGDRLLLKTPFGLHDHKEGWSETIGFQTNPWKVKEYLRQEYPHWKLCQPIMEEWHIAKHSIYGDWRKEEKLANILLVSTLTLELARLARGHKSFSLKVIKQKLKLLKRSKVAC